MVRSLRSRGKNPWVGEALHIRQIDGWGVKGKGVGTETILSLGVTELFGGG